MFITFEQYIKESLDFEHTYKLINVNKGDYTWDTGKGDNLIVSVYIANFNKIRQKQPERAESSTNDIKQRFDIPSKYGIDYTIYISFKFQDASYNQLESGEPTILQNLGAVKDSVILALNEIGISYDNLPPNIYLEFSSLPDKRKENANLNSNRRFRIYNLAIKKLFKNAQLFFEDPGHTFTEILVKIS